MRTVQDTIKGMLILIALYLVLTNFTGARQIFEGLGSFGEKLTKSLQGR